MSRSLTNTFDGSERLHLPLETISGTQPQLQTEHLSHKKTLGELLYEAPNKGQGRFVKILVILSFFYRG